MLLRHLRKLPDSAKIINTDYGSSYLAENVQNFLQLKNIQHFLGRIERSYDGHWIEDFWKRIKYDWFTQYPTIDSTNDRVINLMHEYRNFFNK